MRPVYAALCDSCEDSAASGRRVSAETLLGYHLDESGFANCIGQMLRALAVYADSHLKEYNSTVAEDYFIGVQWRNSLASVRALLNGETGLLDCGDADRAILAMYRAAGFEGDDP